jgi:hypothetical protein
VHCRGDAGDFAVQKNRARSATRAAGQGFTGFAVVISAFSKSKWSEKRPIGNVKSSHVKNHPFSGSESGGFFDV